MKTIIISGSSGFIGNYIKNQFSKKFNIISLEKKNNYNMKRKINIKYKGKIDYFIHTAFQIDLKKFSKEEYFHLNYLGVLNALEFCKNNNIIFIFLSTYLYGKPKYLPIDTKHPINPHNYYSLSKYKCEKLCYEFKNTYNINSIILRLFNIYGVGQRVGYIFSDILNQINNETIYLKHFQSKRDYLHIEDFAELLNKIILSNFNKFYTFNVGFGKSTSVKEIIMYFKIINKKINFLELDKNNKESIIDCYADIEQTKNIFNWQPKITIEEGIGQLIKNA